MRSVRSLRLFGTRLEDIPATLARSLPTRESQSNTFFVTLGWISAGAGALSLGLIAGRELRRRYKFKRRTPYDLYAHAGDYNQDVDFGVGI
jgi:hypothetical protein